jgi:hypothetical protein
LLNPLASNALQTRLFLTTVAAGLAAGFIYGGPAMKRSHNLALVGGARFPTRKSSHAVDDLLMFCCVSAFFAGLVVAVTTLPF